MGKYTKEYFQIITKEEKDQAEALAKVLVEMYHPKTMMDLGCATGMYMKPFIERGVNAIGCDYSEEAFDLEVLQVPQIRVFKADLRKPLDLIERYSLTLCLEVVEHIGNEHVETVVDNLCAPSDIVVMTAAAPGQAGLNHVTLEPQAYWQEKFEKRGWRRDFHDEYKIVSAVDKVPHHVWIVRNLMVFKK